MCWGRELASGSVFGHLLDALSKGYHTQRIWTAAYTCYAAMWKVNSALCDLHAVEKCRGSVFVFAFFPCTSCCRCVFFSVGHSATKIAFHNVCPLASLSSPCALIFRLPKSFPIEFHLAMCKCALICEIIHFRQALPSVYGCVSSCLRSTHFTDLPMTNSNKTHILFHPECIHFLAFHFAPLSNQSHWETGKKRPENRCRMNLRASCLVIWLRCFVDLFAIFFSVRLKFALYMICSWRDFSFAILYAYFFVVVVFHLLYSFCCHF